jgi:hypothetical protein
MDLVLWNLACNLNNQAFNKFIWQSPDGFSITGNLFFDKFIFTCDCRKLTEQNDLVLKPAKTPINKEPEKTEQ